MMRLVLLLVVALVGCGRYFGTSDPPDAGHYPRPDGEVYYPDAYWYDDAAVIDVIVYPDAATSPPDAPTDAPCHISPGHPQGGCTGHP